MIHNPSKLWSLKNCESTNFTAKNLNKKAYKQKIRAIISLAPPTPTFKSVNKDNWCFIFESLHFETKHTTSSSTKQQINLRINALNFFVHSKHIHNYMHLYILSFHNFKHFDTLIIIIKRHASYNCVKFLISNHFL